MNTRSLKLCGTITVVAGLLSFGAVAGAQQPPGQIEARIEAGAKKLEAACAEDVRKFCGTVTPGEGHLFFCIQAHEDKISSKCDFALFDSMRNLDRALDRIEQVADACGNDIEKFCSDVPDGGGRVAQCLTTKKTSLKPACQAAVTKLSAGASAASTSGSR